MIKIKKWMMLSLFLGLLAGGEAFATERIFTYTYEPETIPKGAWEFENWVTARLGRNKTVGQDDYNRWDFRQELEYGVTDNYLLSVYLNQKAENFEDPATGLDSDSSEFEGVSIENKFLVMDPATHRVGLALYIEPTFAPDETELEEKIILGQRSGLWKWALNLTHATVWADDSDEVEGEIEVTFGLSRELNKQWSLGVEFRNHNEIEDYEEWKHTAFFAGPVVSYRHGDWWVTVTSLFQFYGDNNVNPDPDGEKNFVLDEHEYVNVRCIVGLSF